MQKPARSSNLELYRIIVMLLIVAHHYVVNSGLIVPMMESPLSAQSIFYFLFGAWGKIGINCFVMITGYFMCTSQITTRKFMKLLLEVLFYNVVIYLAFVAAGYQQLSLSGIFGLLPGRILKDNFTSCFLTFYLCIPFLNILVRNMSKRQHQLLIVLCMFIYTLHTTLPRTYVTMNYVSWFCVIYFIASYLRLYPGLYDKNLKFWRGGVILCLTFSVSSILGKIWMSAHYGTELNPYRYVADSNELLAVLTAVTSFMYFKNLNIKQSRWINTVAASTFGVLLIHANSDTMRQWLWKDLLDNAGHYADELFYLRPIIATLLIFIVCVAIDYLRIRFIEKRIFK